MVEQLNAIKESDEDNHLVIHFQQSWGNELEEKFAGIDPDMKGKLYIRVMVDEDEESYTSSFLVNADSSQLPDFN